MGGPDQLAEPLAYPATSRRANLEAGRQRTDTVHIQPTERSVEHRMNTGRTGSRGQATRFEQEDRKTRGDRKLLGALDHPAFKPWPTQRLVRQVRAPLKEHQISTGLSDQLAQALDAVAGMGGVVAKHSNRR